MWVCQIEHPSSVAEPRKHTATETCNVTTWVWNCSYTSSRQSFKLDELQRASNKESYALTNNTWLSQSVAVKVQDRLPAHQLSWSGDHRIVIQSRSHPCVQEVQENLCRQPAITVDSTFIFVVTAMVNFREQNMRKLALITGAVTLQHQNWEKPFLHCICQDSCGIWASPSNVD